jgi:DNA repair protein RadA/Sms
MSEEAKERIAEAVRQAAIRKRLAQGLTALPGTPGKFVERPVELVKMQNQVFAEGLFDLMETEKSIDLLFTEEGGVPKACNFMMIGDPGAGKSTIALDILSDLHQNGHKVLFISAEMTRIDLHQYVQRFPKFGAIDVLFTGEYFDNNPKDVIEKILTPGYDVVLIDSFAQVQSDVKEGLSISTNAAEKWLTNTMLSHNSGANEAGKNTTFIVIQQVTKDGAQLGTNRLKHAMTGMIELRKDPESGLPFAFFSKNRRGATNKRMFYSLVEGVNVRYDMKRFIEDESGLILGA